MKAFSEATLAIFNEEAERPLALAEHLAQLDAEDEAAEHSALALELSVARTAAWLDEEDREWTIAGILKARLADITWRRSANKAEIAQARRKIASLELANEKIQLQSDEILALLDTL